MSLIAGLFGVVIAGGIPVLIVLFSMIRQIEQYERGVVFSFGKYATTWGPGWHILIPVIQKFQRVDMRIKVSDVPDQETMTKDNIPIKLNAVIYYRIIDAAKATIEVEHYNYAVTEFAQVTMRNVVGEVELDDLLSKREEISQRIQQMVDVKTDTWGIDVQTVELKDVVLPDNMKRTIAKQAEAEREKRAVIINSEGELQAAQNIAQAAMILGQAPGALHLRTLTAINDMSSDQSNTVVFALPVEILRAFDGLQEYLKKRV